MQYQIITERALLLDKDGQCWWVDPNEKSIKRAVFQDIPGSVRSKIDLTKPPLTREDIETRNWMA